MKLVMSFHVASKNKEIIYSTELVLILGMCDAHAEIHRFLDNHCFLIKQLNFTSLLHVLKIFVFYFSRVFGLNYYWFTVLLIVFCHHLLLQVSTLELGRVLVSHVAPGKALLNIDLNDLDISPCVTETLQPSHVTYFGF